MSHRMRFPVAEFLLSAQARRQHPDLLSFSPLFSSLRSREISRCLPPLYTLKTWLFLYNSEHVGPFHFLTCFAHHVLQRVLSYRFSRDFSKCLPLVIRNELTGVHVPACNVLEIAAI